MAQIVEAKRENDDAEPHLPPGRIQERTLALLWRTYDEGPDDRAYREYDGHRDELRVSPTFGEPEEHDSADDRPPNGGVGEPKKLGSSLTRMLREAPGRPSARRFEGSAGGGFRIHAAVTARRRR